MTASAPAAQSVWRSPYGWVSVGAVSLVFLAALTALAVTTVMPVVSDDLDGASLYAAAFSATLASSVIGMVAAGAWCDRRGPVAPLAAFVALFVTGLLLAAVAASMPVVVAGRVVQGLGTGGVNVALYVVVARAYPPVLHARVFALFSAAWVVPSLVGPFVAGAVAQYLHWRWVFAGIAVLSVAAFAAVAPRLRHLPDAPASQPGGGGMLPRFAASIVVAAALLALGLAAETGPFVLPLVIAAGLCVIAGVRPLLPRGTLRASRALPSVVLLRGVLAAAFFSAEVYVPLYFVDVHGFTPTWAGLALTLAALAWASASHLQGAVWRSWTDRRIALTGSALLVGSLALVVAAVLLSSAGAWAPVLLITGWTVAGGGMGLVYPRLSVLTLAYSSPADQGANSAALSISDAVGASAAIAVLGLVFTGLGGSPEAFPAVFAVAVLIAVAALLPAGRLAVRAEGTRSQQTPS
jgi:MFS family permease